CCRQFELDGARAPNDHLPGWIDGSRRGVSVDSGNQNAGRPRGAPVRKRYRCREISGAASESGARALSRFEIARGSQTRGKTDAWIREHAGVRYEGRAAGGAALLRSRAAVPAGGESWRSGVAGNSSDLQFALQHEQRRIAARGRYSGNGARFD